MPTQPVDDCPYCVHCGYAKAGLEPDAEACPECGHPLDDTFIPTMPTPPRWYRIHRTGWILFRYAGWTVELAISIIALAMIAVMIDALTGDGSVSWSHSILVGVRYVAMALIGLGALLNAIGGACCLATVPAEPSRDHQQALLFSSISFAIPLLTLPAAYAIVSGIVPPRGIVFGSAIVAIILIGIDARLLSGRADAFVLFATSGTEKSFFDEGKKLVDGYAVFVAVCVVYLLLKPHQNGINVVGLLCTLAVIAWISRRARAARAVRKQIAKARRHAEAEPETETVPATA